MNYYVFQSGVAEHALFHTFFYFSRAVEQECFTSKSDYFRDYFLCNYVAE